MKDISSPGAIDSYRTSTSMLIPQFYCFFFQRVVTYAVGITDKSQNTESPHIRCTSHDIILLCFLCKPDVPQEVNSGAPQFFQPRPPMTPMTPDGVRQNVCCLTVLAFCCRCSSVHSSSLTTERDPLMWAILHWLTVSSRK